MPRLAAAPFLVLLLAVIALAAPAHAQFSLIPGGQDGASEQRAAENGTGQDGTGQDGTGQDGTAGATAPDAALSPEAARALAEALQDPAARQALIDELLSAAERAGAPAAEQPVAEEAIQGPIVSEGAPSVARRIAQFTTDLAEEALALIERIARAFGSLIDIATGDRAIDWDRLNETLIQLAIVAGATVLAWWVVGIAARRIFSHAASKAAGRTWIGRFLLMLGTGVVDALVILLAWGGGYGLALWLNDGRVGIVEGLFLNAFLLIELIKVVLRLVLSPRHGELRLMPVGDHAAGYWYFWLARLAGLLGYGMMLVVPAVNTNLGWAVGAGLKVLIALAAAVLAVVLILVNRSSVRQGLRAQATRMRGHVAGRALVFLSRVWHLLALLYVFALFTIWLARPFDAMSFMVQATLESVAAIVLGFLAVSLLTRAISGGMRLPDNVKRSLPLLEGRLNAFVPNVLKAIRFLVLIAVLISILQSWDLIDFTGWVASDTGGEVLGRLIAAAVILLVAMLLWVAMTSWVEYRLNPDVGRAPTARLRTLLALFRNGFTVTLLVVAVMLALSELGVNIGPLLAGAGVVGLAVGFGAQKLVQDIITGAFIQFENALNEGDVVTLAGISGVVEKLTIRSVALRDLSGIYHLIPFSSVDSVSNFMKGFSYHLAEIGVAYRENIDEVKRLMLVAFDELKAGEHGPEILEPFEMHGVTQFADSSIVVRGRIKTKPGSQWAIGRAYNEIVKRIFDENGVEIPFPHVTLYMGQNKDGSAPPMHIQADEAEKLTDRTRGGQAQTRAPAPAPGQPPAASTSEPPRQPDSEEPSEESKQDGPGR
jgi:small conductance mechanosensitive channel